MAEGRTTECLKNIICDGNSYQMLQKLDKPLQPCFAGIQPNLSDTPQLKWDQHKTLITPSRKLLQIHGPLKCLAENKMFYKCVFMNVFDRVLFVLGSRAWDTKSKNLNIFIFVSFLTFMSYLNFFGLLEWDGNSF